MRCRTADAGVGVCGAGLQVLGKGVRVQYR